MALQLKAANENCMCFVGSYADLPQKWDDRRKFHKSPMFGSTAPPFLEIEERVMYGINQRQLVRELDVVFTKRSLRDKASRTRKELWKTWFFKSLPRWEAQGRPPVDFGRNDTERAFFNGNFTVLGLNAAGTGPLGTTAPTTSQSVAAATAPAAAVAAAAPAVAVDSGIDTDTQDMDDGFADTEQEDDMEDDVGGNEMPSAIRNYTIDNMDDEMDVAKGTIAETHADPQGFGSDVRYPYDAFGAYEVNVAMGTIAETDAHPQGFGSDIRYPYDAFGAYEMGVAMGTIAKTDAHSQGFGSAICGYTTDGTGREMSAPTEWVAESHAQQQGFGRERGGRYDPFGAHKLYAEKVGMHVKKWDALQAAKKDGEGEKSGDTDTDGAVSSDELDGEEEASEIDSEADVGSEVENDAYNISFTPINGPKNPFEWFPRS